MSIVMKMDPWSFYGLGYCMGQYFMNKYVVVYGLCGEASRVDGIPAPTHPKCVARIHLYSDMWKYFDRGLYKFLLRYIYIPTTNSKYLWRQIASSFMCFAFIFVWHGVESFILTWSILNFLSLVTEGVTRVIGRSQRYRELTSKHLSPRNIRRLHCALISPLLALSAISNFYFFAGQQIGNLFLHRILHDTPDVTLSVLLCLYCCCQISVEIKNREMRKDNSMKIVYHS